MKIRSYLVLALGFAACSGGESPTEAVDPPDPRVARLTFAAGLDQTILGGRRSTEPFLVRAEDSAGEPVAEAIVEFDVSGTAGGVFSQPRALTNAEGIAETYLLESRSGRGTMTARVGNVFTQVQIVVERAPGELRFEEATGAVGLPGLAHPDSVVRVQVLDSEGLAMAGVQVWFAGPRRVSRFADTTDVDGWASTIVRESPLRPGESPVFAFILAFPELTASTPRPVEAAATRVVLVSMDGMRADAIDRYAPPTLTRLMEEGSFTDRGRSVLPSLTAPAHLSLFSSVSPTGHGVFGDDIEFTAEMAQLEPLFRSATKQGLGTQAFIASESPLEEFEVALQCKLAFGLDSLNIVAPGAANIVEAAVPALLDAEIEMIFLHLPDPDQAGHAHGWDSPEYGTAIAEADEALAQVVELLEPETLLIVTSDHGGGGSFGSHQHGSDADADLLIPTLLWGSRVIPGSNAGDISILDVAPTALWALGLTAPSHYEGRVLLGSFR